MNQFHLNATETVSQSSWKKIIIVSGLGILIASIVIGAIIIPPLLQHDDRTAPLFSLTSYNGTSFSLSDFEGQVIVLNIMSTSCPVCADQITGLQEVLDTFGNDVVVVSVSIGYESDTALENYAQTWGVTWLLAADTGEQNVYGKYAVAFIPTTVIIDPNLQRVARYVGGTDGSEFISEINQLLSNGSNICQTLIANICLPYPEKEVGR
ncbi:MAG: peroxiredoxin family protein [Candidatus Hermodarchaeia archaeon]|jgi:peroxiredoxin